jgi:flavin-dependent dehydrogenase
MFAADVVVAGGGVSGLLMASALAPEFSVLLVEQCESLPRNKYWLTDEKALTRNPQFKACVNRRYEFLDFVAYDGLTATINGTYCLWDTDKLIGHLTEELLRCGARILTGHRLYSLSTKRNGVTIRANAETINARLVIDCMGFGSPLVGAKDVATITGYYILHGREVGIKGVARPVALDNVAVNRHPAFFELFPTAQETAHAAIILPSRDYKAPRSIVDELSFILCKSHYSSGVNLEIPQRQKPYFGIVPVGHLHQRALDRILFFGEAGQANPAASATGLTRMLHTYRQLALAVGQCLKEDKLTRKHLLGMLPPYMTRMNRIFQESLFESLLSYNSDDFRRLVQDLKDYPADVVNGLLFAEFDFGDPRAWWLAADALLRPRNVLGRHLAKALGRFFSWRR